MRIKAAERKNFIMRVNMISRQKKDGNDDCYPIFPTRG